MSDIQANVGLGRWCKDAAKLLCAFGSKADYGTLDGEEQQQDAALDKAAMPLVPCRRPSRTDRRGQTMKDALGKEAGVCRRRIRARRQAVVCRRLRIVRVAWLLGETRVRRFGLRRRRASQAVRHFDSKVSGHDVCLSRALPLKQMRLLKYRTRPRRTPGQGVCLALQSSAFSVGVLGLSVWLGP